MFARNLRPSNYEDAIRKQEIVLSMLNKTKILLYIFLIDHFLINGINCAESLNVDLVGKEFEDLMIKEHNEQSNTGIKTSKPKETTITDPEEFEEKNQSVSKINFSTNNSETDNLPLKIKLLEGKIVKLSTNFDILQNTTIPNLSKTCEELKELCNKINNKIKELKKLQFFNLDLIDKIEKTTNENLKNYHEKSVLIDKMRIETEKSISHFEVIKKELNDKKIQDSMAEFYFVYEYGELVVSIIHEKSNKNMKFFETAQNGLQKDKKKANSVLTMLSNFLKATPEPFEANKKLAKAISSLK